MKRRILSALSANLIGQALNVIIQLASVPIFLHSWGVKEYGEWLVLTSVATTLSMSDFGLSSVAANDMTMQVATDNREKSIETFQTTLVFISISFTLVFVFILLCFYFFPLNDVLKITFLSKEQVICIIAILGVSSFLSQQSGLLAAVYRSEGNYATGIQYGNVSRLTIFLFTIFSVSLGFSPTLVATSMLAGQLLVFLAWMYNTKRRFSWVSYGFQKVRISVLFRLVIPSLAFMGFPLGNALGNQGVIMIITSFLGSQTVTLFSTMRTLSRLGLQLMNSINAVIWPEFSTLLAQENIFLARKIHRFSCQISFWIAIFTSFLLLVFGKYIFLFWTQGAINPNPLLFASMLLIVNLSSLWFTSSVVQVSVNQHNKMSFVYLTANFSSLVLAMVLTPWLKIYGTIVSLFLIDLFMNSYVVRKSLDILGDNPKDFFSIVLTPPNVKYVLKSMRL